MKKRLLFCAFALMVTLGFTVSAQKDGAWTGWVTDSHCGANGAKESHADCAKKCVKDQNAKYALYNPADKKVYQLDAQDKAAALAGKHVKVAGTLSGDAIKVKSIEAAAETK